MKIENYKLEIRIAIPWDCHGRPKATSQWHLKS